VFEAAASLDLNQQLEEIEIKKEICTIDMVYQQMQKPS